MGFSCSTLHAARRRRFSLVGGECGAAFGVVELEGDAEVFEPLASGVHVDFGNDVPACVGVGVNEGRDGKLQSSSLAARDDPADPERRATSTWMASSRVVFGSSFMRIFGTQRWETGTVWTSQFQQARRGFVLFAVGGSLRHILIPKLATT